MRTGPVVCSLLVAALSVCVGCDRGEQTSGEHPASPSASAPPADLPPLELTDDTEDLLLTWVDSDGNFHVVQQIADVPEDSRNPVRVVVTSKSEGTGERVYVADLSKKQPAGTYPVRTMTRSQWEEIGASKREARLEALSPSAKPPKPPSPPSEGGDGKVSAVIYGADWCQPCHAAEKLLKGLGVDVTKKNIEKSAVAHREMQQKLAKINRHGASIPVIDVEGQIMVGYSASALKQAVNTAQSSETL